ncbi:MAG: transglutaminase-like domain-containing protein [Planctomycetaceae bacterium]
MSDDNHPSWPALSVVLLPVLLWLLAATVSAQADESMPTKPGLSETWFVIRYDDQPVGFEQIQVDSAANGLLRCHRKTELNLNRMGQGVTVSASLWTSQTPGGMLQTFHLQRVDGSGARVERSGMRSADGRRFQVNEKVTATRRQYDVAVPADTRSPIVSLWLPSVAMASGSRATVPVFFPESSAVSDVTFHQLRNRTLRLSDHGQVDARCFEFSVQADPASATTLLTDERLHVLRQEKKFLSRQLSLEATSAENALSAANGKSLDLDVQAGVPVDRLLSVSANRQKLILDLVITEGFLPRIPDSTFQSVQVIDESTARITLTPPVVPRPDLGRGSQIVPTALPATRWMPTNDPVLLRYVAVAVSAETDPGMICQRLEAFVHSKMRRSPFSTSFLPADEVAKIWKGDCTEHAVLLATLIRIKGIPARVVSGLVHTNRLFGFVGHMWVEARVHDRWIPFDSTLGLDGVGTTHLKLSDSEMPDSMTSGVSLFLPVLELAGRARMQVVSDR